MQKQKKEARAFSIRMAAEVYNRMELYCQETGVPKTVVIERAVSMYIDKYEETQRHLKQIRD